MELTNICLALKMWAFVFIFSHNTVFNIHILCFSKESLFEVIIDDKSVKTFMTNLQRWWMGQDTVSYVLTSLKETTRSMIAEADEKHSKATEDCRKQQMQDKTQEHRRIAL